MLLFVFTRLLIAIFFVVPPTLLVLTLLALILVRWGGGSEQEQDRCSQWGLSLNMDELARCAATGSASGQIRYGRELFRAGRQEEAETLFETAFAGSGSEREKGSVAHTIAGRLDPGPASARRENVRMAERWYRRAYNLGSNRAAVDLGLMLLRNGEPNEADRWFEQAVERSGGSAAIDIAINLHVRPDRPQFTDEAVMRAHWLRRGAELGDVTSMSYYAEALRDGEGRGAKRDRGVPLV